MNPSDSHAAPPHATDDDTIDVLDLFRRLGRGLPQIIGLALLGLALAGVVAVLVNRRQPVQTATRVGFSFPGFERGEYPDKSKFQADDLRAPAVLAEAIRRQGLDGSTEFQSKIRGALSIEGIIPPNIVKERDRIRATGQTPPPYIPDEYAVSLTLRRGFSLDESARGKLLAEIVSVYAENFRRNFGQPPVSFGTAFETLRAADYSEYELILTSEMNQVRDYLESQSEIAKNFRSASSNFTFNDLIEQSAQFAQIQLNETLGLIRDNGVSQNRKTALMKMDFYLRQLGQREEHAVDNEKVIRDLLKQTAERSQNPVLGVKSQPNQTRNEATVVDQGLIDSLLANDSYSFLVRKALDAGLEIKQIQAEKRRIAEQRANLESFLTSKAQEQAQILAEVDQSVKTLEANYNKLMSIIRRTHTDFAAQQYGDAIRLSAQITTESLLKPLATAGIVGGFLGFALGAGLSLLGIYIGKKTTATA